MAEAEKASKQKKYHVQRQRGLRKQRGLHSSSALPLLEKKSTRGTMGGRDKKK